MAKKPKEAALQSNSSSIKSNNGASNNIFQTLFGDIAIPEDGATSSASIFSDKNPFRRKPNSDSSKTPPKQEEKNHHELGLGFGSLKENTADAAAVVKNKRKRSIDKIPNIDSVEKQREASEALLTTKKSKKGEDSNLLVLKEPLEANGEGGNRNLVVEGSSKTERKGKEKKKRKRDELEADYEAKRFGTVVLKDESGEGGVRGGAVGEKRKTMDSPEDMLDSKEGFDDEDKLLRTVFVGNLPVKVKKKALLKEFSQFGEVESVRIRSVPILNGKTPRKGAIIKKQINDSVDSVHAYIVFKMEESAQASLSHNMAMIGGNHIRVDRACPPRKKLKGEDAFLYDNKRTVFVGNLPFDVKDEEIYQLFSGIKNLEPSVEAVRVIRDPSTSLGKGIAYVLFKTKDAANLVVKKHNLKIRDRDLRLSHAKANSTPSKRKNLENNTYPSKKLEADSKAKASLSYQGMRASKSGVQKKAYTKPREPVKLKTRTQGVKKPKERTEKRPAVAARKAKALTGGATGGSGNQAGKKRKLENQTPDIARRNKKAKKFR